MGKDAENLRSQKVKDTITDQSSHHFALWTMGFGGAEVTALTLA